MRRSPLYRWTGEHDRYGPLRALGVVALVGIAALAGPRSAGAQEIVFESEFPRTLVFIAEEGEADVATRDFVRFLDEAGFPLVDPALAKTAAQRELVQAALVGDEGAAVQLGRDMGAQLLILGRADWGARPNPVDRSLITGTAELEVRSIRMDTEEVVASARAQGRTLEATTQAARTAAIRRAAQEVLTGTGFIGQILNDWTATRWTAANYFEPDPGSVHRALREAPASGDVPRLAVLNTAVAPADDDGLVSRGIGVVKKGETAAGVVNRVTIDGVVLGPVEAVDVEGTPARLEPLPAELAATLGLQGDARRFVAETRLPVSRDTLRVVARGPGGAVGQALAAPRVDERWAVVVGVGAYRSDAIPDLEYTTRDAEAVYKFLRSDAAGPFEEDHILFLTDEEATADALREALFVFLQQADWDDLVVIYFAGHGAPDPERPENLYLLPVDADPGRLAATAFPMWDVKTALRRQIAAERVVVIADACHSGGTGEGLDNPIGGSFARLFTPSRRLTLTAADMNELSFEDERWGGGHGVFTYHLLQALNGAADTNGDGIVAFGEAAAYVADRVHAETDGRQNPQRTGLGDVPLAVVPAAAPR